MRLKSMRKPRGRTRAPTRARPRTHIHTRTRTYAQAQAQVRASTHAHTRTSTRARTHARARTRKMDARTRVRHADAMHTVEKAYKDGRDAGSARRPPQRRACGHHTQRAVHRRPSPPVCVRCSGKAAGCYPLAKRLQCAADTWLGTHRTRSTLAKVANLSRRHSMPARL
jgi:hypothetical protein